MSVWKNQAGSPAERAAGLDREDPSTRVLRRGGPEAKADASVGPGRSNATS
jgi:hypothetical protein